MRPMTATAVAFAAGLLLTRAYAQPASPMAPAPSAGINTADFVKKAAISDMYEVQAGQLAQSRSQNADVKAFAARMIHDHTATTEKLKGILASTNQISLAPSGMDQAHRELLSELKKVSAGQFDQTYGQQQVQAHEDAVALFTGYSQNGQDAQIKKFAADTLPTIQDHLNMARKLPAQ